MQSSRARNSNGIDSKTQPKTEVKTKESVSKDVQTSITLTTKQDQQPIAGGDLNSPKEKLKAQPSKQAAFSPSSNSQSPLKGNNTSTVDIKKDVLEMAKKSLGEKVNMDSLTNLDLKRIQETLVNRPKMKQKKSDP